MKLANVKDCLKLRVLQVATYRRSNIACPDGGQKAHPSISRILSKNKMKDFCRTHKVLLVGHNPQHSSRLQDRVKYRLLISTSSEVTASCLPDECTSLNPGIVN
jgi:hypothetical protein